METYQQQAQENIPPQGYAQEHSHRSQGKSSSNLNQSPLYPHGTWALNPNTDPIKYRTSSPDKSLKPSQNFQSPALSTSPGSHFQNATVKPFTTPKSQFISNKQDYLKPPTHRSSNSQVISGENAQSLFDSTLRERSLNIQDSQQRLSGSRVASSSLDPFTSPKYNKPIDFLSPKSTFDKLNEENQTSHDEREKAANVQDKKILSARKETDDFINGLLNKYGIGSMKESIETKIVPSSFEMYSRPKSFAFTNGSQVLKSPSSYIEGARNTNALSAFYSPPGQSAKIYYPNVYSAPQNAQQEMSQETYDIDTEHLSSQLYGQTTGSIDSLESVAFNQQGMAHTKNPYIHIDNGDYLDNQKFREASMSQPNTMRTFDRTVDDITERRHLTEEVTQTIGTSQNIEEARDSDTLFDTTERRSIEGHRMVANTIEDEDNNPDGKTSESNAGSDVADMSSVVLPEEEEAVVQNINQKADLMNYQETETRTFGDVVDHNDNFEAPETFRHDNKDIMVDYHHPPLVHIASDKENYMNFYKTQEQQQFIVNQGSFPMPVQSVYSAQITNPYSQEEFIRENQFKSSPQVESHVQENYFDYRKSPQRQWTFGPSNEETSRFRESADDFKKELEKAAELPLQQQANTKPEIQPEIFDHPKIEEEKSSYREENSSLKDKESEESQVDLKNKEEVDEEEYEEVEEIEEISERGSVNTTEKRNILESIKAYSTFGFVVFAIFFWYHLVSISEDWERELDARFPDL